MGIDFISLDFIEKNLSMVQKRKQKVERGGARGGKD